MSSDNDEKLKVYRKLGRPYLISVGLEGGVKFIFTMSPLMATVAANSEFIQTNITYDNSKDYPYIFNAVTFSCTSMECMVIGRVRLDKQNKEAYSLAFKRTLERCSSVQEDFEVGQTLLGIITDWSDAEINGLEAVVGHAKAIKKDVTYTGSVLASL